MNLFQRIKESPHKPNQFTLPFNSRPKYELALSVTGSRVNRSALLPEFNFAAGLCKGLWSEIGGDQKHEWHESQIMVHKNSERHRNFIDDLIRTIWADERLNEGLRLSIGKHINLSDRIRLPVDHLPNPYRYEGYIDLDIGRLKSIPDHQGRDILACMFYTLLGYNKYGDDLKTIIFSEEEEWKKSNMDHTVLQDSIRQLALSDSKDSILTEISEIPPTTPQEEGT